MGVVVNFGNSDVPSRGEAEVPQLRGCLAAVTCFSRGCGTSGDLLPRDVTAKQLGLDPVESNEDTVSSC